ncbi:MAG TPA: HAD family phosphatase [Candidatus Ozemobacteraceae bacterium]|nr:HAD family phosphatase [Candidatus Ozemobacteraceae bacterium]
MPQETAITLPIRMVLFDYGNVLEFVNHRRSAARLCEGTGRDADALLRRFLLPRGPLEQLESGMIDADGFRLFAGEAVGREFSPDEFASRFSDMFVMREDTTALLRALRGRYRLGLLSNTNEIHFATTISNHPCFGFFDQVTLSFEVKAMKPAPAIYRDALAKAAGIPPAEILYLDDIPAYAEAARACGMQALVYDSAGTTAANVRRLLTGP